MMDDVQNCDSYDDSVDYFNVRLVNATMSAVGVHVMK
jgi:hypothetical protein